MAANLDFHGDFIAVVTEHVVIGVVATIAIILRFNARRITKAAVRWDDWLALVAWSFMWADTALTSLELIEYTEFRPSMREAIVARPPHIKKINELMLLNWISIYFVSGCQVLVRLSVILLYYRLFFVKRRVGYALITLGVLSVCWLINMYVGSLFACRPIRAIFNATVKGKCLDVELSYVITNSVDTALDFAVLSLPIPVIWTLHLPTREKLGLIATFLAGGMVIATGLVRIVMATKSGLNDLKSASQTSLWNGLHLGFAVICCCMPVFRVYLPRGSNLSHRFMAPYRYLTGLLTKRKSDFSDDDSREPSLPSFVHKPESTPHAHGRGAYSDKSIMSTTECVGIREQYP